MVLVTTLLWIGAVAVALFFGWFLGRGRERPDPLVEPLDRLASGLADGRLPAAGAPAEVERVREAVERAWVPRDVEREESLKQALGRIAAFLEESVEAPLRKVLDGDRALLREGADRALRGLADLEFYLREPITPDETHDLVPLVQQVVRDFIADWEVAVRFTAPATPVRAHIHRDTFLDALYLVLHNAGHFSGWKTVDVQVEAQNGRVAVRIRDRGPGFTPESLARARDLFYTTKPAGLGLGIPFARKIIEGFGGQLELTNRDGGGAEVTLGLPAA